MFRGQSQHTFHWKHFGVLSHVKGSSIKITLHLKIHQHPGGGRTEFTPSGIPRPPPALFGPSAAQPAHDRCQTNLPDGESRSTVVGLLRSKLDPSPLATFDGGLLASELGYGEGRAAARRVTF